MLIGVYEAVSTIYHQHDRTKETCEGRFGRSRQYGSNPNCLIIESDYFDEVIKIVPTAHGFIALVNGSGAEGKTVEDAVRFRIGNFRFEFKI